MASSASAAAGIEHPENPSRRDFLYIATAAMGAGLKSSGAKPEETPAKAAAKKK